MNAIDLIRRAPLQGALFLCLALLVGCANGADRGSAAQVRKVIDGDTITLKNGDTVRFLGVNAPELGHGKFVDEPFAELAQRFVAGKIAGRDVRLVNEREHRDRYGRRLAQVITSSGENLQTGLLEQGLAFAVAVGEGDFGYLDDYLAAQSLASKAHKGVWGDPFFAPVAAKKVVDMRRRGFLRVIGRVKRVGRSKNNRILFLPGGFRVLISHRSWQGNFEGSPERYIGKTIEVRGWVFKTHGITGVKVYHPAMLVLAEGSKDD